VLLPMGELSKQYFPGTADDAKVLIDSKWPEQAAIITLASEKVRLPVEPEPAQPPK
jgi:hypothetical protein